MKRIAIHFKHCRVLIESTQFNDGLLGKFRLNNHIFIVLLHFRFSLLDPFEQILLVCDQLENASVFAKILEGLTAFDAAFLFKSLFLATTRLTNGMLVFTNHDGCAIILIVRVLAGNTCESSVVHKHDIVDGVLFAGFSFGDILSGLGRKYLMRLWFYFLR